MDAPCSMALHSMLQLFHPCQARFPLDMPLICTCICKSNTVIVYFYMLFHSSVLFFFLVFREEAIVILQLTTTSVQLSKCQRALMHVTDLVLFLFLLLFPTLPSWTIFWPSTIESLNSWAIPHYDQTNHHESATTSTKLYIFFIFIFIFCTIVVQDPTFFFDLQTLHSKQTTGRAFPPLSPFTFPFFFLCFHSLSTSSLSPSSSRLSRSVPLLIPIAHKRERNQTSAFETAPASKRTFFIVLFVHKSSRS